MITANDEGQMLPALPTPWQTLAPGPTVFSGGALSWVPDNRVMHKRWQGWKEGQEKGKKAKVKPTPVHPVASVQL